MKRCNNVTVYRGKTYRCQGDEGHYSAHYSNHLTWENRAGLPIQPPWRQHTARVDPKFKFVVGLLVALLAGGIGVVWFIIHFR